MSSINTRRLWQVGNWLIALYFFRFAGNGYCSCNIEQTYMTGYYSRATVSKSKADQQNCNTPFILGSSVKCVVIETFTFKENNIKIQMFNRSSRYK